MGGGDHSHDLGPRMKVPDYRIYKAENHPELRSLQEALAYKGLKDPWIRNEAWRFSTQEWGTPKSRILKITTRGMKYGFGAFLVTLVLEKAYSFLNPSTHHDHH